MKVRNITNMETFFGAIDSCKGKVELLTDNGDRLNLKSKLSQFVSFAKIRFDGNVSEMEIITHNPDDAKTLFRYMMNN